MNEQTFNSVWDAIEDTPQQAGEELAVSLVKAFAVEQMGFNRCLVVTTHQRLVKALQDEFAGQSTR